MAKIRRYQEHKVPMGGGSIRVPLALARTPQLDAAPQTRQALAAAQMVRDTIQLQQEAINTRAKQVTAFSAAQRKRGVALAEVLDAVAETGERFFRFGARLWEEQQTATKRAALVGASAELDATLGELKAKEDDFTKIEQRFREAAEKIKEKYGKGLYGGYADAFEQEYAAKAAKRLIKARSLAFDKAKDARASTRNQIVQRARDMILQDPSAKSQEEASLWVHKTLQEDVAAGFLSKEDAAKAWQKWQADLGKFNLNRMIEENPVQALSILEGKATFPKGHPDEGKKIPLPAGLSLDDVIVLRRKAEAKVEDWYVDRAYQALNDELGPGSYEAKLRAAMAMDELPAGARKKLVTLLRTEWRTREELRERNREKSLDRGMQVYFQLLRQGDYTKAREVVDILVTNGVIKPDRADRLYQGLTKKQWGTDPKVYAAALRELPRLNKEDVLAMVGNGLAARDAEHLLKLKRDWDKAREDQGAGVDFFKEGIRYFKAAVSRKEAKQKLPDFTLALQQEMEAKGLSRTSPEVLDLAKGLLRKVVVEEGLLFDKEAYAFEEKVRRRSMGLPSVGVLREADGSVAYDPDLPDLEPEDLQAVYDVLRQRGVAEPALANKMAKDFARVEVTIGTQAMREIMQYLHDRNEPVNPTTIMREWERRHREETGESWWHWTPERLLPVGTAQWLVETVLGE